MTSIWMELLKSWLPTQRPKFYSNSPATVRGNPTPKPFPFAVVDAKGADNGLRFVDLDKDGYDDLIVSNSSESAVRLYDAESQNFTRPVEPDGEIPLIVRGETNNGAWFADDHHVAAERGYQPTCPMGWIVERFRN